MKKSNSIVSQYLKTLLLLSLFLQASCSQLPLNSPSSSKLKSLLVACERADVTTSPQFIHHPHWPVLAANRFLLSYQKQPLSFKQWQAWLDELSALQQGNGKSAVQSKSCMKVLRSDAVYQLREELFSEWHSSLYAAWPVIADIMKPFVNRAVEQEIEHNKGIEKQFRAVAHPLDMGMLKDYQWYGRSINSNHSFQMSDIPLSPLGLPELSALQREALLDKWQPLWAINSMAENDRPLSLARVSGELQIDKSPSIYRYISYGRLQGEIILQLNYVIWFAERKPEGWIDLLAGQFDGIQLRSHLDLQGNVLAYDAMHSCGCWYQLFSSPKLRQTKKAEGEPVYLSSFWPGNKAPIVVLSANQHQLRALLPWRDRAWEVADKELISLNSKPYSELESLFDKQGLLAESIRLERFLFAPLGVKAAGSMRSRGRHQIAFTSERYFDQPDLLESLGFERVEPRSD
ncbi:hypothetical protein [uncultured Pseudoteredinibacter sp.]|uniref:hypothetical protein n=1 Tax=uncultured Pseudoteredinibacter sp. TaxID=1641701 RepID=UPI0026244946|nr:hypothetical protein [uncultured Pseudoteredinibacter sp.]